MNQSEGFQTIQVEYRDRRQFLTSIKMERRKGHSDAEYMELFKEMTDMLIEIIENDDSDGKKSDYLDRAITHWRMRENKKNGYSKCIYKPPPKELKFCY